MVACVAAPLLGYTGDRLGCRLVLATSLLLLTLLGALLPLLPTYSATSPTAALLGFNSSRSPPWEEVVWVGEFGGCQEVPVVVGVQCGQGRWQGEGVHLPSSCTPELGVCGGEETCTHTCSSSPPSTSVEVCTLEVAGGGGGLACGSHSTTFWAYLTLRTLYTVFQNTVFNLSV